MGCFFFSDLSSFFLIVIKLTSSPTYIPCFLPNSNSVTVPNYLHLSMLIELSGLIALKSKLAFVEPTHCSTNLHNTRSFCLCIFAMDFDMILPDIGEFGRYQKLVLCFVLLPGMFPCGFHAYNQLFMAGIPDHWCKIPELKGLEIDVAKRFR